MRVSLSIDPGKEMKKFLFDGNDFSKTLKNDPSRPIYNEEQARQIRDEATKAAKSEALSEAAALQETHIAKLLEHISAMTLSLSAQEETRDLQRMADSIRLSLKVIHKLLPRFAEQYNLDEMERVILDALETRKDEPRIAVTVSSLHLASLKDRIDRIAIEKGYAGKMIIIADDNLAPTDCRVEWADGGAERLYERLYAQIENEFAKTMSAVDMVLQTDNKNKTQ
jgi:flagellar assembly protein FliH